MDTIRCVVQLLTDPENELYDELQKNDSTSTNNSTGEGESGDVYIGLICFLFSFLSLPFFSSLSLFFFHPPGKGEGGSDVPEEMARLRAWAPPPPPHLAPIEGRGERKIDIIRLLVSIYGSKVSNFFFLLFEKKNITTIRIIITVILMIILIIGNVCK